MANTCKRSLCLNKYFFFLKKVQLYFREIDSYNMYAKNIENEEIMNLKLEGFIKNL